VSHIQFLQLPKKASKKAGKLGMEEGNLLPEGEEGEKPSFFLEFEEVWDLVKGIEVTNEENEKSFGRIVQIVRTRMQRN
jgi:hypothetical protein